jgi:hypothetical protein
MTTLNPDHDDNKSSAVQQLFAGGHARRTRALAEVERIEGVVLERVEAAL